jgi:class 3 adenylate cyclase
MEQGFNVLALFGPSVAGDAAFREWWDRSGHLGTTPAMARALMQLTFEADVRHLLPQVQAPTVVIHRADVAVRGGPAIGRYLADHIPNATFVEVPGADWFWWTGDIVSVLEEVEEFMTGVRSGSGSDRVLATVLFTDIVKSTERAATMGDERWRDLLERHDDAVKRQVQRYQGRMVGTSGDGSFSTFDSPGRAIDCALAIRDSIKALNLDVRSGIHTGEIEVRGDDLAGLTVHIGARVMGQAGPGEILVSSTVRELLAGSHFAFSERGEHELKGVPGVWKVFAVAS